MDTMSCMDDGIRDSVESAISDLEKVCTSALPPREGKLREVEELLEIASDVSKVQEFLQSVRGRRRECILHSGK